MGEGSRNRTWPAHACLNGHHWTASYRAHWPDGRTTSIWPTWRRSTTWCTNCRGPHRHLDVLLGPTGTTTTRPRHQGAAAYCSGVEYPRGLQSSKRRLHYLFPTHFAGVPAKSAGIPLTLTATVVPAGQIDLGLDRLASPKKRS